MNTTTPYQGMKVTVDGYKGIVTGYNAEEKTYRLTRYHQHGPWAGMPRDHKHVPSKNFLKAVYGR